jgi:hypothetical protein
MSLHWHDTLCLGQGPGSAVEWARERQCGGETERKKLTIGLIRRENGNRGMGTANGVMALWTHEGKGRGRMGNVEGWSARPGSRRSIFTHLPVAARTTHHSLVVSLVKALPLTAPD